jgi:hypothetical protein
MKATTVRNHLTVILLVSSVILSHGQTEGRASSAKSAVPSRISTNTTVPKQTPGATFGERVGVAVVDGDLVVLFPSQQAFRANPSKGTVREMGSDESAKVNAGLHAAGGALAQGASLLGGHMPGGAIISAALTGGDAGKPVWEVQDAGNELRLPASLPNGQYALTVSLHSGRKNASGTQAVFALLVEGGTYRVTSARP